MADYRPLVLSGTAANSVITELPTSSILITDGSRFGASSLSISGSVSATDISSVGVSCVGGGGAHLFIRRDDGASYPNLIRATDGTITVQTEDDIHFKSNNGEDFARFNENAAVWLYYNNSKKIETTNTGASITGLIGGASSVSATDVSAINYNGMPYPQPFAYVECSTAGTNTTDEINFAAGATTTTAISDTNHIAWNDGEKYFTVSATGTYELLGNFVVDAGSQSDPIELRAKKNGTAFHTISPKLYGTVGPEERTFHSIFTASTGDYITVSIEMDDGGSKTAHLEAGSNLTLKRIK